jgi:hypothetical protein
MRYPKRNRGVNAEKGQWQHDKYDPSAAPYRQSFAPGISERQLTTQLSHCKNLNEVLNLIRDHGDGFNSIHIQTALWRLTRLCYQSNQNTLICDDRFKKLVTIIKKTVARLDAQLDAKALTNIVKCLADLHVGDQSLLNELANQIPGMNWQCFDLDQCATLMWSFAKINFQPSAEVLRSLLAISKDEFGFDNPVTFTNMIFGIAKIDSAKISKVFIEECIQPVIDLLIQKISMRKLPTLSASQTSKIIWSIAQCCENFSLDSQQYNDELSLCAAALTDSISVLNVQKLTNVLRAFAQLRYQPENSLLVEVDHHIKSMPDCLDIKSLCNVLWAFSKLDFKPVHSRNVLRSEAKALAENTSPRDCVALVWGLTVLNIDIPSTLKSRIKNLHNRDLSSINGVQLFHAYLFAQASGKSEDYQKKILPDGLYYHCRSAWKEGAKNTTQSNFQATVKECIDVLLDRDQNFSDSELKTISEYRSKDKYFSFDIALRNKNKKPLVVIECDGPRHFFTNNNIPNGETRIRDRIVKARYPELRVISVPFFEWPNSGVPETRQQRLDYLREKISSVL